MPPEVIPAAPAAPAAPPAAAPNAPAAAAPPPAGAAPQDWTASLNDDHRQYVQTKGFKDPASVVESYRNFEKLRGVPQDRLLKLPDSADAPEWGEVYDRLGRPKDPADYKLTGPEDKETNKEFTQWAQKQFHELGLTRAQGEKLAAKWNEYAVGDVKSQQQAYEANLKIEDAALRREFGMAYDQKMKFSEKAAGQFGLAKEQVSKLESALGYSATIKLLSSIGEKLGEDTFVGGDSPQLKGALTPDQARAEITALKSDREFTRRYLAGDREAHQRMTRLHEYLG